MKKEIKRLASLSLSMIMAMGFTSCGETGTGTTAKINEDSKIEDTRGLNSYDYTKLNLTATDDLGRTFTAVDGKKADKTRYTGMFFYLTLGYHGNHSGIYDVSKITEYGANMSAFNGDTEKSPVGAAHFWGEPVWGYYQSSDPWVITKQVEMMTMMGIDFMSLDVSNAVTYDETVEKLLNTLLKYQSQGWSVPKIFFYCNAASKSTIKQLYAKYYTNSKYDSIWFAPEGKPIITEGEDFKEDNATWNLSDPTEKAISEYFHFKLSQWPSTSGTGNLEDGIPWVDFQFPQYNHSGWMCVSPAQHSKTVLMSDTTANWGRGFNFTTNTNESDKSESGQNFQSQWNTVLNDDSVQYVFITQWNEWVAEKGYYPKINKYWMCDNFNEEYSRDLEPNKNGYGDNFYLQTMQNIRDYAFTEASSYKNPSVTININNFDASQWSGVNSVYKDFAEDAVARDYFAFDRSFNYTDDSNRNDIVSTSVCRDSEYMYFRVETLDDITAYEENDKKWMNILIKTDNGGSDSLFGYQYVLNRKIVDGKTYVYKSKGGNSYSKVGEGDVAVNGNVLQVRVKLSDLGLTPSSYHIEFKVCDNIQDQTDILSYYNSGDSAPIGRLSYDFGK